MPDAIPPTSPAIPPTSPAFPPTSHAMSYPKSIADSSIFEGYSEHWSDFAAEKGEVGTNQAYVRATPSTTPDEQKTCDVDVLNHELIKSHESTVKALEEINASLEKDRDKLTDDNAIVYHKICSLERQVTFLNIGISHYKRDKEVLKSEITQLKTEKAHYKMEGQVNRNKLRELKLVLRKS